MNIAIAIRGHVRHGLTNNRLLEFVSGLINRYPSYKFHLYFQTWNESEAKSSYKPLNRKHILDITENYIYHYFHEYVKHIKKIFVLDDTKLQLSGDINGKLGLSSHPKIAWKRMWAGQYKLIDEICNSNIHYDWIINMRFDMFTNEICKSTPPNRLLRVFNDPGELKFLYPKYKGNVIGVDNFIVGRPQNMLKLIGDFHHNLDEILFKFPQIRYQEEMVYHHAIISKLV